MNKKLEINESQLIAKLHHPDRPTIFAETNYQSAAVLIPLVRSENGWNLLFTRRATAVRTHAGEVSFPGGGWEENDKSLLDTVFREVNEEIGVKQEWLSILGRMDPIKTITCFFVYPFVGILKWPIDMIRNNQEVENIFIIPVDWLANPNNYYEKEHHLNGSLIRNVIHFKDYEGEHLWGFTARLTLQLIDLLK
jgi:8-oxo-dGTP pyrophosphatase MutT (NUDIX family)